MRHEIPLSISGLGIIFYSPFAVAHIRPGQDYLKTSFFRPEDVAAHVMRCDISAFCTGSGGDYLLTVYDGALDQAEMESAQFKVRLGLEVRGREVCFRDLYDLMDWTPDCPVTQKVRLADGFYRITAYTSTPASGITGDAQRVYLHFEKAKKRPVLKWEGVPQLCAGDETD